MVRPMDDHTLLPIGRFARATGLTVKALRHYDDVGLLRPAHIEQSSGYRYYDVAQVRDGKAIRRLRSLEVPVPEIANLLEAGEDARRAGFVMHGQRLVERMADKHRALLELSAIVEADEDLVPLEELEIEVRDEPELRLAAVIRHIHNDEMNELVPQLISAVADQLLERGVELTHAPIAIFRSGDAEGWHLVELGWPVPPEVNGDDRIGVHVYPATRAASHVHVGPYDEIHPTAQRFIASVLNRGYEYWQAIRIVYLTDTASGRDPASWRARLVWPIR